MATTRYRHNSDRTVRTNRATPKMAPGHPPELQPKAGAENLTPPPTKQVDTLALARSTSWGHSLGDPGDNPGKNGFGGASSLHPGERAGAATIKATAPVDAVLDNLITETRKPKPSTLGGDSWQTRSAEYADAKGYPITPGTANRGADSGSPGGAVPLKTGNPTSDWDARRAAMLKQAK